MDEIELYPFPWVIAEYLPCGVVRLYTDYAIWRDRAGAQAWASHCMHCMPCVYRRPVPLPTTGVPWRWRRVGAA